MLAPREPHDLVPSAVKLCHRDVFGAAAESCRVILVHRDPRAARDATFPFVLCWPVVHMNKSVARVDIDT